MALSVVNAVGNGISNTFSISFPLGYLSRADVKCRVGSESDGLGDPVYRSMEWVSDSIVNINGPIVEEGVPIAWTRTVSKTQLVHDYVNGAAIEEKNLDESNKQVLMAIHEFLDGRFGSFAVPLNMNGFKIINVAPGTEPNDVATVSQLGEVLNDAGYLAVKNDLTGPNRIGTVATNMPKLTTIHNDFTGPGYISTVAQNIGAIQDAAEVVEAVEIITPALPAIENVSEHLDAIDTVNTNMPAIEEVQSGMTAITGVYGNLERVNLVADNMTKVNSVSTNMTALTNINTNMSSLLALPAQTSSNANTAQVAADLASRWASEDVNVPVVTGEYSAYHWAQKAAEYAGGSPSAAGVSTNQTGWDNLSGTNVQDVLDNLDDYLDSVAEGTAETTSVNADAWTGMYAPNVQVALDNIQGILIRGGKMIEPFNNFAPFFWTGIGGAGPVFTGLTTPGLNSPSALHFTCTAPPTGQHGFSRSLVNLGLVAGDVVQMDVQTSTPHATGHPFLGQVGGTRVRSNSSDPAVQTIEHTISGSGALAFGWDQVSGTATGLNPVVIFDNIRIKRGALAVPASSVAVNPTGALVATNVQTALAELDTDLSAEVSARTTLAGTVSTQGTTISGHTTTLGTHTTQIGTLQGETLSLDGRLDTIEPIVSGHTTTIGSHTSSISSLSTTVGTHTTDIAANTTAITKKLTTDPTGITGAAALTNIVSLTTAQYDAIGTKDASTLYVITDA